MHWTGGAKPQIPFALELQYHRRDINSNPNSYIPSFPLLSHQPFSLCAKTRTHYNNGNIATVNRKHRMAWLIPKVKMGEA